MQRWIGSADLLLLLLCAHNGFAATLFEQHGPLAATLEGPLSRTTNDGSDVPGYLPYRLLMGNEAMQVSAQPRGSSRRAVCRFPPLRVRFERSDAALLFAGQHKLKLVTHCNSSRKAEQNVLEEYFAYRMLGVLTEASFRVRLIKMTYRDSMRSQRRPLAKWAFFIEDVDALSQRIGGRHVEPPAVAPTSLDPRHTALIGLFQYMIGNTDYSLTSRRPGRECCHNAKLIQLPDRLVSVPYDFDQAGLVDADYAGPNPVYAGRNVRARHYQGICTAIETLQTSLGSIQAQREVVFSLLDGIEGMSPNTRKRARKYLQQFFTRVGRSGVQPLHERCQ